ncbi:MAG: DUF4424 family protein [Desulfobacteraceae bacterium]|nr:DUF4424 family protein [Desulfobacteraceae bacterium]
MRKFTLIVEKSPNDMIGFCFDGKIIQQGHDRFESTVYNFIPKADLSIIYISSERFRSLTNTETWNQ